MHSTPANTEPGAAAAAPALELKQLSVGFPAQAGFTTVVYELSLAVRAGECLGVVGESGAGKSQAFLAAMGLAPRSAQVTGSVRLSGAELAREGGALRRVRGAELAMVFQDPMSSLTPHMRVGDQIAEVLVRHRGASWRAGRRRAQQLLERVHVGDAARRLRQYPFELSGGLRQRVMIAMALACDPVVLIADEPTTSLDVTIQAQILALLAELKHAGTLAIVLITHDLAVVAGLADRVAVLERGRLVELGATQQIFAAPVHPATRLLLRHAQVQAGRESRAPPPRGAPLLELKDLAVRFPLRAPAWRGRRFVTALSEVSLELAAGEALGIVGESGSGKSTLVRAILQLVRATAGEVIWLGHPLQQLSARALRALRRDLQIIFQDPLASLDPRMSVLEIIAEPLRLHRAQLTASERETAVLAMLARVGLPEELAQRYPHQLSGGQCQRVGIARAMILKPKLLVCDEPVSALDVATQAQVIELLAELRRESATALVIVSHNLALVRGLCDRVLVLYLGRVLELAATADLFAAPLHPYTRALLEAIPVPDPALQPARLATALAGELPSALSAPAGCVFHTRCAHAVMICAHTLPPLEPGGEGRLIACHRWRELRDAHGATAVRTGYSS